MYADSIYSHRLGPTGEVDARMFCVINKKIALIKMVSKSARKQQHEMEESEEDREAAELAFQLRQYEEDEKRNADPFTSRS